MNGARRIGWVAATLATAACHSGSSPAPSGSPDVHLSAQAVSSGGAYLSWRVTAGSCGASSAVHQDGAVVHAAVHPLDFPGSWPERLFTDVIGGLSPGTRYCFDVVVTVSCHGGFSGGSSTYELASDTACLTTLPATAPPDVTRPAVVSTSPADGASGTWRGAIVSVQLSELVDPGTVTRESFFLSDAGVPIPGGSLGVDGSEARLLPAEPLASGRTYTASVTDAVKDLAGNALVPYAWTFTVQ